MMQSKRLFCPIDHSISIYNDLVYSLVNRTGSVSRCVFACRIGLWEGVNSKWRQCFVDRNKRTVKSRKDST